MPASFVSSGSGPGGVSPEAIIEWLQDEMGYPSAPPALEQLRKICRGNMLPVWSFLLRRVLSELTVSTARKNILVHGIVARRAWNYWHKQVILEAYENATKHARYLLNTSDIYINLAGIITLHQFKRDLCKGIDGITLELIKLNGDFIVAKLNIGSWDIFIGLNDLIMT
ncbi:hypothetical protein ABZP36_020704 [Zizania latifolia]